jgi:acyl carrier protein
MGVLVAGNTDVERKIRAYIAENIVFVAGDLPFADDDSFLEKGIIDSTGILELQLFVEEAFGIQVRDEEVLPENFDSISQLAAYVARKLGKAA